MVRLVIVPFFKMNNRYSLPQSGGRRLPPSSLQATSLQPIEIEKGSVSSAERRITYDLLVPNWEEDLEVVDCREEEDEATDGGRWSHGNMSRLVMTTSRRT